MIRKLLLNVLIGVDQLVNAILGGDPDENLSGRIGKIKVLHNGRIPWKKPIPKITDNLLNLLDKDHCIEAIEQDEGKDAL